eukprot:5502260-Pyramimonas_sp.AAC.1
MSSRRKCCCSSSCRCLLRRLTAMGWGTLAMYWGTLAMCWGYPGYVLGYPGSVLGYPGYVLGYPGSVMGYPGCCGAKRLPRQPAAAVVPGPRVVPVVTGLRVGVPWLCAGVPWLCAGVPWLCAGVSWCWSATDLGVGPAAVAAGCAGEEVDVVRERRCGLEVHVRPHPPRDLRQGQGPHRGIRAVHVHRPEHRSCGGGASSTSIILERRHV